MKSFAQQPTPVPAQVELPPDFPEIPLDIVDRFGSSAQDWQRRLNEWYSRFGQAIQQAQDQTARQANSQIIFTVDRFLIYANGVPTPMFALDATGVRLGNVLVVNTPGRKIYIGAGEYANANTPFYVDTLGNFSLGDSFVWDADTDTLTITGVINATSGTIGGFEIGANYIRDTGNTFGLSSVVSGSQDVRFWAGDSFANRDTAPVRIYEDGTVFFDTMLAARITGQGDGASNAVVNLSGSVATAAGLYAQVVTTTFTVGQNASSTYLFFAQNNTVAKSTFTGLTAYGIRFGLSNATGTGTIDNAYGIYIDTVNIGTANWGLYVATTARNFMAGDLTVASIGATTPGSGAFTTVNATVAGGQARLMASSNATGVYERVTRNGNTIGYWGTGDQIDGSSADNLAFACITGNINLASSAAGMSLGSTLTVSSLAGVGTRTVVADASGNLSAP